MSLFVKATMERGGFELSYCMVGEGVTTFIIGSSIYYPRTFSQNLHSQLKMIFMDHRGFSKTLKHFNTTDFDLTKLIDDIEALRQKLNLDKIAIIGHSGHAFIALEYAKKYPNHVSHVILIATSPTGNTFTAADQYFAESVCPERKALYEKNMQLLKTDIEANPDKRFILYSLRSGPRIWYDYRFDASHLWEDVTVIPDMFDYVWGSVFKNVDITKNLDNVNKPVLLMLGRYDYWNPPHLWESLRPKFKNLTIRVFEKSGHTPQLEEPDLFNKELINWLSLHR